MQEIKRWEIINKYSLFSRIKSMVYTFSQKKEKDLYIK